MRRDKDRFPVRGYHSAQRAAQLFPSLQKGQCWKGHFDNTFYLASKLRSQSAERSASDFPLIHGNKLCNLLWGTEITSLVQFGLGIGQLTVWSRPELESLVGNSKSERMYCIAHSLLFSFYARYLKAVEPLFWTDSCPVCFWHRTLTSTGFHDRAQGSNFTLTFLFLLFTIVSHCNWKLSKW